MPTSNHHTPLFRQHLRHVPNIDAQAWHLIIDGYVQQPLTLNYSTLQKLSSTTIESVLSCSGHNPTTPLIGSGVWRGVSLAVLLSHVTPQPRATFVSFQAADGYTTSLPITALDGALLAHTLDGAPLPAEHGAPLRLILPARSGYKQPKWITHITLTDQPTLSLWEKRGASSDGFAAPVVTLDAPTQRAQLGESVILSGSVYGGAHTLNGITLQLDGGALFTVPIPPTAHTLTQWQTTWQPSTTGRYALQVSGVVLADGNTQALAKPPALYVEVYS